MEETQTKNCPRKADGTEQNREYANGLSAGEGAFIVSEGDQDWDIFSPVIPNFPSQIAERKKNSLTSMQIEANFKMDSYDSEHPDPWKVLLVICSLATTILFVGLTAGSFFYPWFDTKLELSFDKPGISPFPVTVPMFTDAAFQNFLDIYKSSRLMCCIIIFLAKIVPSLCCGCQLLFHTILGSSLLYHKNRHTTITPGTNDATEMSGWDLLKAEMWSIFCTFLTHMKILRFLSVPLYAVKFAMVIAYGLLLLELAATNIHMVAGGDYSPSVDSGMLADTTASGHSYFLHGQVVKSVRGGFVAYVLGVTFASYSLMIVRVLFKIEYLGDGDMEHGLSLEESSHNSSHCGNTDQGLFLSPPQLAFRLMPTYEELNTQGNPLHMSHDGSDDSYAIDRQEELSTPLLRHLRKEVEEHPLQQPKSEGKDENVAADFIDRTTSNRRNRVRWRDIFMFETCLISVILPIPFVSEPVLTFHYFGSFTPLFENDSNGVITYSLRSLVVAITSSSDSSLFSVITSACLWLNIVILPLLCWICCAVALLCIARAKDDAAWRFMEFAKFVHPLHHLAPFVISIILCSWLVQDMSNFLFDQNILCQFFQKFVNTDHGSECLKIFVTFEPALFAIISQAIATDVFILFHKE